MRSLMIVIFVLLISCAFYYRVEADSKIRAADILQPMPTPTFEDVHLAYFRIVANEAPFRSVADHDGILQALLYGGGGRRYSRATGPGVGYGLDYSRLMKRMIAHSPRTFPANSRFLLLADAGRLEHKNRQSQRNLWSSSLHLDCSASGGWRQFSSKPIGAWRKLYGKRCQFAVRSTEKFLKGRLKTQCDGRPTTWGNEQDTYRPGGPVDSGWKEIFCN